MRCFALRISAGLASTPLTGLVAALPPRLGPACSFSPFITGNPYPAANPLLDVGHELAREPGREPFVDDGFSVGKFAIGRGRGVEGIIVIPHPVPPPPPALGVRALPGPPAGVRVAHPEAGEAVVDGLSRKWEDEEASRDGRCGGGGMAIFPISGRVGGGLRRGYAAAGGETGAVGPVEVAPAEFPPVKVVD